MINLEEDPFSRAKRYIRLGYEQNNMDLIWFALSFLEKHHFTIINKHGRQNLDVLRNICKSHIVYCDYIGHRYFRKQERRRARKLFGDKLSYPKGRKLFRLKKILCQFDIFVPIEHLA